MAEAKHRIALRRRVRADLERQKLPQLIAVFLLAILLLGLVLAFFSRSTSSPQPQPSSDPRQTTHSAAPPIEQEPEPEPIPSPSGYLLRSYDGRLAVFREGSDTPEMIFDVYTRLLPQSDRERLEDGISAPDYETLTRLIEDYIS